MTRDRRFKGFMRYRKARLIFESKVNGGSIFQGWRLHWKTIIVEFRSPQGCAIYAPSTSTRIAYRSQYYPSLEDKIEKALATNSSKAFIEALSD